MTRELENETVSPNAGPLERRSQLIFSDQAAKKVRALTMEEDNENLRLRVFVSGGGCSGFQYEWQMTDETDKGVLIEDILVLDKLAEMFVIGCTVDYVQEFGGSYLKVINPNATAQCGCGESFAV